MTINLSDKDVAVLKALLSDGRKSFRQISREIGISTPTVKVRFSRLVNMGIIKSISPILDLDKLSYHAKGKKVQNNSSELDSMVADYTHRLVRNKNDLNSLKIINAAKRISVHIKSNYCNIPLLGRMYIFKFANIERFFCCAECRLAYKKKYAGRIEAITTRYSNKLNHKKSYLS
jgi:DNA-binding Lrp family transcriptional regulator